MVEKEQATNFERVAMGRIGTRPYWVLNLSIVIRAIHQVGAAVFLASFLLVGIIQPPPLYLFMGCVSGIVLVVTEAMRHRQIHRELSGAITLVKLLLLGIAFHRFMPATQTVLIAFVLASIGAHAPKYIRHKLLF
jgi:hypothetical protein